MKEDGSNNQPTFTWNQVCGPPSTTISGTPTILANSAGVDYLNKVDNYNYVLSNTWTSSNSNCPIESIEVVPVLGGSVSDYLSDDLVTPATVTSLVSSTSINVQLP
jgi:hypothetical protein